MLMMAVDTVMMELRVMVTVLSSRRHDDHGPNFGSIRVRWKLT